MKDFHKLKRFMDARVKPAHDGSGLLSLLSGHIRPI